ncbi:hypothetical protein TNCV_3187291 [Trichonephila clavipes]|nr:hypothetical protein TNCV_3187291 [Trichonephila clavipes]
MDQNPHVEARKFIVPQLSQTYAQATKPSTVATTNQTDENISKIVCPTLKLLQPLISVPKPTMSSKIHALTKSSTKIQAHLLPPTSSVPVTSSSESQPPIPLMDTTPATNSLSTSAASSSSNRTLSPSTSPMFTALSTVTSPSVPEPITSTSSS